MIAENKISPPNPRLTWAAECLETSPGVLPQEFTFALLRRVEEEDFVPPAVVRQAWEVAVGKSAANPAPLDELLEDEQHRAVEHFANHFFEMIPVDRNRSWQLLADATAPWPRLKTRLQNLRPGLNVVFPEASTNKPQVRELLAAVQELFILPTDRRALRRRELLRGPLRIDPTRWQSAARYVRRRYRSIAALSPDLILPLSMMRKSVKQAVRNRRRREAQPLIQTKFRLSRFPVWLVMVVGLIGGRIVLESFHNDFDLQSHSTGYQHSPPPPAWQQEPNSDPLVPSLPQLDGDTHESQQLGKAFRYLKEHGYIEPPQNSGNSVPPVSPTPAKTLPNPGSPGSRP